MVGTKSLNEKKKIRKKESSNPLPIIACHRHVAAMLLSLTRVPSFFFFLKLSAQIPSSHLFFTFSLFGFVSPTTDFSVFLLCTFWHIRSWILFYFYYLSTSVWLVGVSKVFYIYYYLLFNCNCLFLLLWIWTKLRYSTLYSVG